ncbi:VOC family protein [Tropicibacter oceani]|uniref:VOC family protein n=1 Tax=Tropicibacter oceani TaxID=3058420 RepID=A0ABY8QMJ7_9RHOB|nr:VOC family protein [Tropicibacter oceani]WGW05683.1 VOC family protein [Tropicibacter oceani]
MRLNPYLTFDGNCEAAMRFYHGLLGGDLQIMKYNEMPDTSMVPDGMQDRVAHAGIKTDGFWLQGSDNIGQMPFDGYKGFTIQIDLGDIDKGKALFDRLSDGGSVIMPYGEQFWARGFGMATDKFGVPWMIHVE